MKFLSIGDVHGRDNWKTFVNDVENYYKIVFVGDYADSFTECNEKIIFNLLDIINFKKQYPDKVVLLLGNHDVRYAISSPSSVNSKHGCSGYRPESHYDLYEIFKENKNLFQVAYQYKNYIWTHAGIHRGWYTKFINEFNKTFPNFDGTLADKLNEGFLFELSSIFDVGYLRWGNAPVGGILWADKKETWIKPLKNYHQICGHTMIPYIQTSEHKKFNASITYIDVVTEPYILEIE